MKRAWLALACLAVPAARAADTEGMLWERALARVRAERADLAIRADRWETRMKLPVVEDLLADPVGAPQAMAERSLELSRTRGLAQACGLGRRLLGLGGLAPSARPPGLGGDGALPQEAREALRPVLEALAAARPLAAKAGASLTAEQRRRVLGAVKPLLLNEPGSRLSSEDFETMARFDLASMTEAAESVMRAVDAALPALMELRPAMAKAGRLRRGEILISGGQDDVYGAEDLEGVDLLVDFGGDNAYRAPVAAAGEGQIRLAIDLGARVSVEAAEGPAASGVFGVGLLYLPNAEGPKKLRGGDFSLGAGFFGVGGLFLKGAGSSLEGGRFTQGAGAFGLGLLEAEADGARYKLRLAGQGFGFTRGVGLLIHRGHDAVLDGGDAEPDPREPLAALSLSQGAGYGPRAFAAGGVGLAYVGGDRSRLTASYMAQGMGYWHALGGLFIDGDEGSVQGRRYAQGAGVHTGVGGLALRGGRNKLATWGVGPAFGWDYGVGALSVEGDENGFTSDWGSGRGDVNGHGLAFIRGARNRLALADLGSGAYKRNAPSYGVVVVVGEGNRYRLPLSSAAAGPFELPAGPWGVVMASAGSSADPGLEKPRTDWPAVPREEAERRDRQRLELRWEQSQAKPPEERVADWLHSAAESGLESRMAMRAAAGLLSLPPEESRLLVGLISPDHFNELIWLRTLIPAFGVELSSEIGKTFGASSGMRQVLLLNLFRSLPASESVGPALRALRSPHWRLRREAVGVLGHLLDRQRGDDLGRLALLAAAGKACEASFELRADSPEEERWIKGLGEQRLPDLFAVLSLGPGLTPDERVELLLAAQSPFEPARKEALRRWLGILRARRGEYAAAIAAEIERSVSGEKDVRRRLAARLKDEDSEVIQAALANLGGIGDPRDARKIAAFLEDPSALLRETAAASLGRMGAAGRGELAGALKSPSPRTRSLAAVGIAATTEAEALGLLKIPLRDPDAGVRLTAVAALSAVQTALAGRRAAFRPELAALQGDPSSSVRMAAQRALALIGD